MRSFYFLLIITVFLMPISSVQAAPPVDRFFEVQAIDTMKTSRDMARTDIKNEVIEAQVKAIADTGATHVAIGTPYEDEFVPYMRTWVEAARKHNLKVWFRGNLAGWEGWFEYPKIDREEHKRQIRRFIINNPDLFEDGDIFAACPECENGGPGDPRQTGDVEGFRAFMKEEYNLTVRAFKQIKKSVIVNYFSMNGDVARLIMDQKTTKKLGGVVTVDHYVKTTDQLLSDIDEYARLSGGKIVLGEWGAPIPDIHGEMNEIEQATWIESALQKMIMNPNILGLNYWTFTDSSTQLWRQNGEAKKSVEIITRYFTPVVVRGMIIDDKEKPVDGAIISSSHRTVESEKGSFTIPLLGTDELTISKEGYATVKKVIHPSENKNVEATIILERTTKTWWEKLLYFFGFS